MTLGMLAVSIRLLVLIGTVSAAGVASHEDETCLLQVSSQTRQKYKNSDMAKSSKMWPGNPFGGFTRAEPSFTNASRKVPLVEIDLDLPPEERFTKVAEQFQQPFVAFFNRFGASPSIMGGARRIVQRRGPETPELMGEIRGIAKALRTHEYLIHAWQLVSALQSYKAPFEGIVDAVNASAPSRHSSTHSYDPTYDGTSANEVEFLNAFEVPSFGNVGIIARDERADGDSPVWSPTLKNLNGSVWHARSLGLSLPHMLQQMVYDAKFMKGGKEVYTAQMVFPLLQPFTAIRRGHNGYSYQHNHRYIDSLEDGKLLMEKLYVERCIPSGWTARKILEETGNYEDAVKSFSTMRYPHPEYNLISGVRKGTILARDPDKLAYKLDLKKRRYIIMTNFDFPVDDESELLQSSKKKKTNKKKGLSPRERAQHLLDKGKVMSPMLMQNVLNDQDVVSNNALFEAMINVEHDKYSTTLPYCGNCGAGKDESSYWMSTPSVVAALT